MFDLDAYIARVGLTGRPTIAELHRAHVATIPFENLDPHRGVGVSLELDDLQRKLVRECRGGYCFEHNLLHGAALRELGAEVEPMLARVRIGAPPGLVRPPTHLVLRVRADGREWLADVGFASGGLLEPLPFAPGVTGEQSGWRFELVADEHELVLRRAGASGWEDLYGFVPRPAPPLDLEMSNWFTSTHPQSAFVTGLLVSRQADDGSRTTLSDWGELCVITQTSGGRESTPVAREEIPRLLAERFGLPGFTLDGDGRVVRAEQRSSIRV